MTYPQPGTNAERIVAYVKEHPGCSRYEVAKALNINRRLKRIRSQAAWKLERIRELEQRIRDLRAEVIALEVEYEEETGEPLLNARRTGLAAPEERPE